MIDMLIEILERHTYHYNFLHINKPMKWKKHYRKFLSKEWFHK